MPNNTKKKHRTFRKKIGGVKKNKERSQSQSQWYTNWQGEYGMPGSIDVRIDRFQRPRQPRLDPQSSIAGNEISKSRFMNALRYLSPRYLSPRYLSQFFRRKSTPIVETPPSATIVETPPARPSNNTTSKTRTKSSIEPLIQKNSRTSQRKSRKRRN